MQKREHPRPNRPTWLQVHPAILKIALALTAWTVASVWILFSHSYYGPLLYGIVTFLVAAFVALPWILLASRHDVDENPPPRFRDWIHGEFDTASGPVGAGDAAVLILLVPASIAVGMTVFGLAEFLTAIGVLT